MSRLRHRLAVARRETAVARSLDFVEIQNNEATAAVASIENAVESGERVLRDDPGDGIASGLALDETAHHHAEARGACAQHGGTDPPVAASSSGCNASDAGKPRGPGGKTIARR